MRYALCAEPPPPDMAAALAVVEESLRPAPRMRVLAELTRLRSLTVSRGGSDADLKLALTAYAEECSAYPLDAVVAACRQWANAERWWPSWAELRDRLERIVAPRRRLHEALRRGCREPEPEWMPPTAAEKAAVDALLESAGIAVPGGAMGDA